MTADQAKTCGILDDLKFERGPQKMVDGHPVYGGPVDFIVTHDTIAHLRGKKVTVDGDGSIRLH